MISAGIGYKCGYLAQTCTHVNLLFFRLKEKRKSRSPKKRRSRKLSTTSSEQSDNETDLGNQRSTSEATGRSIPPGGDCQSSPDTCPICLCRLDNKSFTDSCFHTFCFVCLQEWAKQKAVCPLCKQKFKSIIHSVRSLDDYDQYYIENNPQSSTNNGLGDRRFRYRTTLTNDHTYDQPWSNDQPWLMTQQLEHESRLTLRPSRVTARGNWRRLRQNATSAFRKRVYAQNMRVQSVKTASGRPPRYRNISPSFFSRNPACTHRLVPWLNRELNVILHGDEHTEFILGLIIDLVQRFDIQSEEFREHIHPFTNRHTELFIHEFFNFARSPYDMVAYDRHAVYDEQPEPSFTVESSSNQEDQNDLDIVILSPPEPRRREPSASLGAPSISVPSTDPSYTSLFGSTMEHVQNAAARLSPLFSRVREFLSTIDAGDTANSGWESPLPGPSSSVMWSPPQATTPPRQSENTESFGFLFPSNNTATTSTEHLVTVAHSFSSSGSESDIQIVGYEKPFEQRTPVAVSSSASELEIIDLDAYVDVRKKKKKKKSRDKSPLCRMPEFHTEGGEENAESRRKHVKGREDKHRREKSRNRSRSRNRERSRRPSSRDCSPRRKNRDKHDRHREKERNKSSHSGKDQVDVYDRDGTRSNRGSKGIRATDESETSIAGESSARLKKNKYEKMPRGLENKHNRLSHKDTSNKKHDSYRKGSSDRHRHDRARSPHRRDSKHKIHKSQHRRNKSVSKSPRGTRSRSPKVRSRIRRRSTSPAQHRKARSQSSSRTRSTSSGSKGRFQSPTVTFRKWQSKSKSSSRQGYHDLQTRPTSPLSPKSRTVQRSSSVENASILSSSSSVLVTDSSSPEKSRRSRSRSSARHKRSRSRSSDCQFFISRSKYRRRDSDDSIEFIVAKPAKRHRKNKKHKKHKKRRYYVIDDTDSEGNHGIEILDVVPAKHKKKSRENPEEKKYKKHHTGHKKSSKSREHGGETSREQEISNRCTERIKSNESVELVGVENRNASPFVGAEVGALIPELTYPQDETMNLIQRRVGSLAADSPDELHRKCEVSSSSFDVSEGIAGGITSQFDPFSVAGEVVVYPLHGQDREQDEDRKGSDSDKGSKNSLPSVKETIANITDTVERELAKKRDGAQNGGENDSQGELNRATNLACENAGNINHRKRLPFAVEWLSSSNEASSNKTHAERKRPSFDPVMGSVGIKSPRFSDTETMETAEDAIATSSADEAPSCYYHMDEQLQIAQDLPEISQSHIAMETEVLPSSESKMDESGAVDDDSTGDESQSKQETFSKRAAVGLGLLPPSCDSYERSASQDPVLFPSPVPCDPDLSKVDNPTDKAEVAAVETTAQTITTIFEAVKQELSLRRSSQSEDSGTECSVEDKMERKSREIVSVGGDKLKSPPPLALDNIYPLGSDSENGNNGKDLDASQSVDPNLYELVGQMRQSPSRSASMILLANVNAQNVFNSHETSEADEPSNDMLEKDFCPQVEENELECEVDHPAIQGSLADISDIVGDLSQVASPCSPVRLDVEKQNIDRVISFTRLDKFEPESSGNNEASDSGVDTGALDLGQSTSHLVAPSLVTDLLQKDIQTHNGRTNDDLTILEKQMRQNIAARLEQKDLLPPPSKDE